MLNIETLRETLCNTFCDAVMVNPVPCGLAVSASFIDQSGDPVGCYVVAEGDAFRIEDDGEYLARLVGSGIPIHKGQRGRLLDSILSQSDAYWDRDTFEIRSASISEDEVGSKLIDFLSALIRVRDLELLTRDVVKSTFKEDALAALEENYQERVDFLENQAISDEFEDFPADLIIRPKGTGRAGAMYFVTSNEKLSEALLLQMEAERLKRSDFAIVALIEDSNMRGISKKKFQRAQNRSLSMPIFRGDESEAIKKVGRELDLAGQPVTT